MSAGRSAAIDDAVPTLKVTHSVMIDAAWDMRFIHRLPVIARCAIAHRVLECRCARNIHTTMCEIRGTTNCLERAPPFRAHNGNGCAGEIKRQWKLRGVDS